MDTLSNLVAKAKADGASSARWDFGHVGHDVTRDLLDTTMRPGEFAGLAYEMLRETAENSAEQYGEDGAGTLACRTYRDAYLAEYVRLVVADAHETRRADILARWRAR